MPAFDMARELRNCRKSETFIGINMNESNSSDTSLILSADQNNVNNDSESRVHRQEEFYRKVWNYTARLTKQLVDLSRLIQRLSTSHRPNFSPRTGTYRR